MNKWTGTRTPRLVALFWSLVLFCLAGPAFAESGDWDRHGRALVSDESLLIRFDVTSGTGKVVGRAKPSLERWLARSGGNVTDGAFALFLTSHGAFVKPIAYRYSEASTLEVAVPFSANWELPDLVFFAGIPTASRDSRLRPFTLSGVDLADVDSPRIRPLHEESLESAQCFDTSETRCRRINPDSGECDTTERAQVCFQCGSWPFDSICWYIYRQWI